MVLPQVSAFKRRHPAFTDTFLVSLGFCFAKFSAHPHNPIVAAIYFASSSYSSSLLFLLFFLFLYYYSSSSSSSSSYILLLLLRLLILFFFFFFFFSFFFFVFFFLFFLFFLFNFFFFFFLFFFFFFFFFLFFFLFLLLFVSWISVVWHPMTLDTALFYNQTIKSWPVWLLNTSDAQDQPQSCRDAFVVTLEATGHNPKYKDCQRRRLSAPAKTYQLKKEHMGCQVVWFDAH